MGRTACTEPQYVNKGALYVYNKRVIMVTANYKINQKNLIGYKSKRWKIYPVEVII
jgi:hypothetical protein